MEVTLALLADAANRSEDGKLNILGTFDRLVASNFPVRYPSMTLVLRFEAEPSERGDDKRVSIRISDEDGKGLGEIAGQFAVPAPASPGERISLRTLIALRDTVFPHPGRYRIDISVGGEPKAQVPLTVVRAADAKDGADDDT